MLDSEGFVRAGWVHDLRLHQFLTADGVKFVIKGKVKLSLLYSISIDIASFRKAFRIAKSG